jgi:MoxR-like ATPase
MSDGPSGESLQLFDIQQLRKKFLRIKKEIGKVFFGQEQVVELLLVCLLCRGHALIEGVPGLGKTLLISTLARALDLTFRRIQFTPDLMPSDITGTEIIEEDLETRQRKFRFIEGPVFGNVILADEINRTPPKTQSALLEAMQERSVTHAGQSLTLPNPFFVLATQNPIESEGTYPLPEAQLDRFMFKILIGYPGMKTEEEIVLRTTVDQKPMVEKVFSAEDIVQLQRVVRKVPVSRHVTRYAVSLVSCTRPNESEAPSFVREMVSWGAGPRASQYLVLAGKARAILEERWNVSIEDIQEVARAVLRHRIIPSFAAEANGVSVDSIAGQVLKHVKEPDYD